MENQPADNVAELLAHLLDGLDINTIPLSTLARLRQSLAEPAAKDTHNMSSLSQLFSPRVPVTATSAEKAAILSAHRNLRMTVAALPTEQLMRLVASAERVGDHDEILAIASEAMARADLELVNSCHAAVGEENQELWDGAWREAIGYHDEDPVLGEVRAALAATPEAQVAAVARAEQDAAMAEMRSGSGPMADVGVGDARLEQAAREALTVQRGEQP